MRSDSPAPGSPHALTGFCTHKQAAALIEIGGQACNALSFYFSSLSIVRPPVNSSSARIARERFVFTYNSAAAAAKFHPLCTPESAALYGHTHTYTRASTSQNPRTSPDDVSTTPHSTLHSGSRLIPCPGCLDSVTRRVRESGVRERAAASKAARCS